jgi:hypothetical protein
VSFNLGAVPGAVSVKIRVTQPSGAEQAYACSDSPCPITVDKRQGAHWYRILYLNAGGQTLQTSDADLIEVN